MNLHTLRVRPHFPVKATLRVRAGSHGVSNTKSPFTRGWFVRSQLLRVWKSRLTSTHGNLKYDMDAYMGALFGGGTRVEFAHLNS